MRTLHYLHWLLLGSLTLPFEFVIYLTIVIGLASYYAGYYVWTFANLQEVAKVGGIAVFSITAIALQAKLKSSVPSTALVSSGATCVFMFGAGRFPLMICVVGLYIMVRGIANGSTSAKKVLLK